ncbi:MAG: Uma2 family endonuclease [Caldilineaceae bacterium]|nr:Uma2 family endonuclease [Caldilineaceae bacterium]
MRTQAISALEREQPNEPQRRLITVDQYHQMGEVGILRAEDRLELLEGVLYDMAAISSLHAACVNRLNSFFVYGAPDAIVHPQNPIQLDDYSEPQPDLAVLRYREDYYASAHPTPADVYLLIEVAYTSQTYDRERKLPLYARFGVPEVWIVDVEAEQIDAFSGAHPQGYREVRHFWRGDTLAPTAFPDLVISVDKILGKPKDDAN